MKRCLWLCVVFLLAGHIPVVSADAACEGRFVNPITDICWSCIFPLSLGSTKVSQGKVPDTANPSMPIQFCPAPPPVFKRIGLAIGYWEPMALTDVTRSPGCMVNLGMTIPELGKTGQGTAKKDDRQVNGAFYHVHLPFSQTLYFINGDDPAQVAWMKRQTPPTLESKIILVQGSIPEMQKSLDSRVYFDQNGALCQRLGIDQVPARVTAASGERFLKVEFIPAEEDKK